jgi:hypothetical protein
MIHRGRIPNLPPIGNRIGASMSASTWERLWNGGDDVATRLHAGAVSTRARTKEHPGKHFDRVAVAYLGCASHF